MVTDRSLQAARALHRQGRTSEAEVLYRELLHAQPDSLEALDELAVLHFQQGRPAEAVPLFTRVVAIRPDRHARTPTWAKLTGASAVWIEHSST